MPKENARKKCRICRRERMKLFLKGIRCETVKCPLSDERGNRRAKAPGDHGAKRKKMKDYAIHLREKQKCKIYYGLRDRQFMALFEKAQRMEGNTGENLLITLERRLDNVVYNLGMGLSHNHAAQIVAHGHVFVNGSKVDIPSFLVRHNDEISIRGEKLRQQIKENLQNIKKEDIPSWLELDEANVVGKIVQLPKREDVMLPINEQLIVEFCTR